MDDTDSFSCLICTNCTLPDPLQGQNTQDLNTARATFFKLVGFGVNGNIDMKAEENLLSKEIISLLCFNCLFKMELVDNVFHEMERLQNQIKSYRVEILEDLIQSYNAKREFRKEVLLKVDIVRAKIVEGLNSRDSVSRIPLPDIPNVEESLNPEINIHDEYFHTIDYEPYSLDLPSNVSHPKPSSPQIVSLDDTEDDEEDEFEGIEDTDTSSMDYSILPYTDFSNVLETSMSYDDDNGCEDNNDSSYLNGSSQINSTKINYASTFERVEGSPKLRKCKVCGKIVSSKKHRFVHMPGAYSCPYCPCVYTRSDNLNSHIRLKHKNPNFSQLPATINNTNTNNIILNYPRILRKTKHVPIPPIDLY